MNEAFIWSVQLVLNNWGDELNRRSEEQKRSLKGKLASATHMQTVSYIKPLFRKLKRHVSKSTIILHLNSQKKKI